MSTCVSCFVLQVSFQHESYPVAGQDGEGSAAPVVGVGPGGEQPLSRQVFIVQELEVRDRLASSQINKFLYLYTSESMPRRAHSNMVRQRDGGSLTPSQMLCTTENSVSNQTILML